MKSTDILRDNLFSVKNLKSLKPELLMFCLAQARRTGGPRSAREASRDDFDGADVAGQAGGDGQGCQRQDGGANVRHTTHCLQNTSNTTSWFQRQPEESIFSNKAAWFLRVGKLNLAGFVLHGKMGKQKKGLFLKNMIFSS